MGTFLKIKMVKESELNESDDDSDDDERNDEEADICDLVSSGTYRKSRREHLDESAVGDKLLCAKSKRSREL
jgi:hypothetical protein